MKEKKERKKKIKVLQAIVKETKVIAEMLLKD